MGHRRKEQPARNKEVAGIKRLMALWYFPGAVAELKVPAWYTKREVQTVTILSREQRELEEITRCVKSAQTSPSAWCAECHELMTEVMAAMRRTRAVLAERTQAVDAGLLDDVDFLETENELEAALNEAG
jgi:hypothetical protein